MTNSNISLFPACERRECIGKQQHPESFHEYDQYIEGAATKEIERAIDQFFERMSDEIDVPFPEDEDGEFTDDDDYALEFRDWFTAQVICRYIRP